MKLPSTCAIAAFDALMLFLLPRLVTGLVCPPGERAPVPIDLLTASGSGLDPQISVVAANYQERSDQHGRRAA